MSDCIHFFRVFSIIKMGVIRLSYLSPGLYEIGQMHYLNDRCLASVPSPFAETIHNYRHYTVWTKENRSHLNYAQQDMTTTSGYFRGWLHEPLQPGCREAFSNSKSFHARDWCDSAVIFFLTLHYLWITSLFYFAHTKVVFIFYFYRTA